MENKKNTIKVKPGHENIVFGFNNSAKPLGQRNDLHLLYADASHHNIKHILDLFEEVTDKEVEETKENAFLEKQAEKNKTTDE